MYSQFLAPNTEIGPIQLIIQLPCYINADFLDRFIGVWLNTNSNP